MRFPEPSRNAPAAVFAAPQPQDPVHGARGGRPQLPGADAQSELPTRHTFPLTAEAQHLPPKMLPPYLAPARRRSPPSRYAMEHTGWNVFDNRKNRQPGGGSAGQPKYH